MSQEIYSVLLRELYCFSSLAMSSIIHLICLLRLWVISNNILLFFHIFLIYSLVFILLCLYFYIFNYDFCFFDECFKCIIISFIEILGFLSITYGAFLVCIFYLDILSILKLTQKKYIFYFMFFNFLSFSWFVWLFFTPFRICCLRWKNYFISFNLLSYGFQWLNIIF